jgi:hypothetical protein
VNDFQWSFPTIIFIFFVFSSTTWPFNIDYYVFFCVLLLNSAFQNFFSQFIT